MPYAPTVVAWDIYQGRRAVLAQTVLGADLQPIAFLTGAWVVRAQLKASYADTAVLATLDSRTAQAPDGEIVLDDWGRLELRLPGSFASGLPATVDARGDNSGVIIGDVKGWPADDPGPRHFFQIRATVTPEVTSS